MSYIYDMIEKKVNEVKNQAVAVSNIAVGIAKAEQEKLENNGVRMSLGAIVSKAVVEKYGKK